MSFIKTHISKYIVNSILIIFLLLSSSTNAAICTNPITINNYVDIEPFIASPFETEEYSYYPITDGQTYSYGDTNSINRSYTVSGTDKVWAIHYRPLNLKAVVFFKQSVNGTGGSSPQGTSESFEIFFNSGPVDLLNFIISDLDFHEGVRVVGYLGNTIITPTVTNLSPNQTLTYLPSGEAQWLSDGTTTDDSENTVSFDKPINKLVITNYKTIDGDAGDGGGFNLHELKTSSCQIQTVPTLSEWALIMLVMLLGITGYMFKLPMTKSKA